MSKYIISGGARLYGTVTVSGSKNSALPIIFASLATHGVSYIENFPDIGDTRTAIKIIECLGAKVSFDGSTLVIDAREVSFADVPNELISRLRASTYLIGAMSVRLGRAEISSFGGCGFSHRPIDYHLLAVRAFGGEIDGTYIRLSDRHPAEISFPRASVGATVNALILAAATQGESIIRGIAIEPHIKDLIDYLKSAGARITLDGNTVTVKGCELSGGRVRIGGDAIEAGTFLALSMLTEGKINVRGINPIELKAPLDLLSGAGAEVTVREGTVAVNTRPLKRLDIVAAPYPAFPTDLQPIFAPLVALTGGSITDTVWQTRFGYLSELKRFGVSYRGGEGRVEIFPSELTPATASSLDLRCGAALTLAALVAEGKSIVSDIFHIERGYERFVEKLTSLGAEIERVE